VQRARRREELRERSGQCRKSCAVPRDRLTLGGVFCCVLLLILVSPFAEPRLIRMWFRDFGSQSAQRAYRSPLRHRQFKALPGMAAGPVACDRWAWPRRVIISRNFSASQAGRGGGAGAWVDGNDANTPGDSHSIRANGFFSQRRSCSTSAAGAGADCGFVGYPA